MPDPSDRLHAALADHYRLERELGAGGMAIVYLAHDLKHQRKVALKVLRPELATTLGPDRFLREIAIAAELSHPHILPLHNSGEADGFLYYVMPFIEGPSLRQRLLQAGELPIDEAARILRDVADALAHAHERGVVHRDIKPENVMLSGRHALVTDFGVAKAVNEAAGHQSLTSAGLALGTPTYMAPEQAAGDPQVDHRADIYAWGVVAYELLAGRRPFDRATPQAVLAAQVTEAAEPVRKHRPSIPAGLARLVMRALEKKPADRWQRAEELIQPLEAVLTPGGGGTPAFSPLVTAASRKLRWKPLAIAGGILAAAAVAAVTVLLWSPAPEYVPNRVVVVPLESQGGGPSLEEFGRQMMSTLTAVLAQEGVGDPVPAARVRDLLARAEGKSGDLADRLARETAAGLVLRGACSPRAGTTECQLELLRMPGRVPRLSFSVAGDPADPRFSTELAERAAVILLLQQQWGDRATWQGEYIPASLEAVREFNEAFDLWTVGDTNAVDHFQRAAILDASWLLPAVWGASDQPLPLQDSTLESLGQRPGLRASDREVVGLFQAWVRGDLDRVFDLANRRFAVNPEMWLGTAVFAAYETQHSETAIRYSQYADSVLHLKGQRLADVYWSAGNALHHLGRYEESLKLASRVRERLPEYPTVYRTIEIMGRAGAGDLEGVQRVVAEAEASVEPDSGWSGTRTVVAAFELMAHGHEAEGRRMLVRALPFYRRLREERGPSSYTSNEIAILIATDQLDEARTLALQVSPVLKAAGDSGTMLYLLGWTAARQGRREEVLQYDSQLMQFDGPYSNGWAQWRRAGIAANLGEREATIRLLQQARAAGRLEVRHLELHRDPEWASLRGYPPFEQLLKPKG